MISKGMRSEKKLKKGKRFNASIVAVIVTMVLVLGMGTVGVLADDLTNTVPSNETSGAFYTDEIKTGFGPNSYTKPATYGPSHDPYKVDGVYQSQSTSSATSFAAGLPLGTIFIDQSKVNNKTGKYKVVSDNTKIIAGLTEVVEGNGVKQQMYDGTKEGAIKLEAGKINVLAGDLYTITFENAAVLPNGDLADLVITYSNARIVVDQRYLSAPEGERYLHGACFLSRGNEFSRGTTDKTDFSRTAYASAAESAVNSEANKYKYDGTKIKFENSNNKVPSVGVSLDATYRIVNKDTTPAQGSFVYAICGINLDRDPDMGASGNNVCKPLWYVTQFEDDEKYSDGTNEYPIFSDGSKRYIKKNTSSGEKWFVINANGTTTEADPQPTTASLTAVKGREYSFFSEALSINGGQVSDNVYVRPNNKLEDNPGSGAGEKGKYYWPHAEYDSHGNLKFISNATNSPSLGGHDNSYSAGFVTLADAAQGFKVTGTGHGTSAQNMNSGVFNSKQIWYRYTSSTGHHGSIQTTSEGNFKGKLDHGNILEPEGYFEDGSTTHNKKATHVVTEGKDVYYTMTPDTGYKLKTLKIGNAWNEKGVVTSYEEVKFNDKSVNTMKKGDQLEVTTHAGNKGLLKYNGDGTYVFKFEYAQDMEAIHVEWEPVTADILASKVWDDEDDKDGMRKNAYESGNVPMFRLEYSINGGRTWNLVRNNNIGGTQVNPIENPISPEQVPSGKDTDSTSGTFGKYLDGIYTINKGTTGTYERSAASPQPTEAQLTRISETCDGLPIFENQKTFKKYVKKDGSYHEVTSVDHPYTWQNLPVYKYDSSGNADRMISYRIVECHGSVDNETIKDYEPAEYYDAQAFELTSEKSKSWEGWQLYDGSGKTYVKRGDELYYEVDSEGRISDKPANPQPTGQLEAQTSDEYRTADKGIPYQMADVRNYHEPKYVYVEVGKEWNDDGIKDVTTGDNKNEYARKNLKFVLKGTTEDGEVDLNGDADGKDLVTIIKEDENKDRTAAEAAKKIDGYQIFEKENDPTERYAWVKGKDGKADGYYKIVGGAVDYNDTNAPYSNLKDLVAIGAFQKSAKTFGMRFDELPTHDGGKPITYSVTEYFEIEGEQATDPNTWVEAGKKEIAWITTGGDLQEVRIIDGNTSKVVGYTADFINTPTIEDVYETLPLTILKQDVVTENPLESAEFTIYRKSTGSKAFDKNDLYEVEGQTIYYNQNDTVEYVLRKKDGQPASDEKLYYHTFKEDPEHPGQYVYTYVTSQPDASELTVKKQMVESNEITTKTNGMNTFNILLPGNYEVKETKAPTGYTADPKSYTFNVDRNLKKITLENDDNDHETKWWKKLWDLLFRDGQPDNGIWEPNDDKKGGKLTVNDQPIDANILVRKYWEDNDDQDGVRPEDGDADMPKVVLEWTTAAHTATGLPVYTDAKGKVKYIHNQTDNKYYKVTKEDEYGKYVPSAAQPQPDADKLTEVADTTCQGRKVYKDEDDNWYVYVDEQYHELKTDSEKNYLVDTQGSVESTPAAKQPKESELRLVMDEGAGWQTTNLYDESTEKYDKAAKAPVNYADGPVLTHQHDAYTWNDVPAYRDGKPVVYRVSEESLLLDDGTYRLKSSHTSDTKEKVFTLINNSGQTVTTNNQTVDVTNRHETRIINIDAYKVWNDDDPTKRKESTLTLWKEVNGARSIVSKTVAGQTHDDTGTVPTTDKTDPVKTWSDLPVFERGYPIKYTIVEESIDGYRTEYELDYTKENGTPEGEEVHKKSDTVDAKDVKRTYYRGATDKKIDGETVYTDGISEYVKRGDEYFAVTGDTIAASPADPQPEEDDLEVAKNDDDDIPAGVDKNPGDESTTASFTIENEETIDIPIKKTWIDGANANVTFQLWRTTTDVDNLTNSKFVERTICYQHNETGNYISVQDYDELPTSEKSKYTAVKGNEWSPYDPEDPSKTVDGWERADDIEHEFLSRDFENQHTPGFSIEETFKNLPRQKIETAEGKTIYKEKTGTNPKKYVLMEDPEATGQDVGKQFYFTFTVDEETGKYTYTKANPQPDREDLQVSYLAYMYRVFEVPKLVRYTADQTSDFNITNYNLHASNGFAKVEVVKELEGRKWDVDGKDEFYFEMEPIDAEDKTNPSHRISKDDIPLPSRMVNNRPVYKDANDKRYVIDGDNLYREVDDNDKVADKPANPQPKAGNLTQDGTINASINYPIDTSKDKKVGAIGRAVDFKSIEFSDESVVPRGNTVEFNYKVREVYDMLGTSIDDATNHTGKRNGISYAGEVNGGSFVPEEHDLKIVVKNDDSGMMTTEIYWDGKTQAGAVPVYTNKYSSESEAKAWIEKEIKTRKWKDYDDGTGDAFRYEILAISGSQLNVPGADHSQGEDSYRSKPLISNESGNPQEDIQKESDNEYAFGLTGNKYTGDMLNSDGQGYFIYAIKEMDKVNWSDGQLIGGLDFKNYKVDGLEYDEETIYAKVKVNDNWDGTLRFEVKYYSDAACRNEITDYTVWIEDKFTGGTVDAAPADPQPEASNLIQTKEILGGEPVYYNKVNKKRYVKKEVGGVEYCYEVVGGTEDKKLMSQAEIKAMKDEQMSQDEKDANGYRQVSVAHFINRETIDIPVSKEWAGGPAVEDVNLHLKRHLFALEDEEELDDEFVKSAENRWTDTEKPFWQPVGLTHIVKRGAFLDANGEPKYDDVEKTISTQTYGDLKADDGTTLDEEDYIKGFNKDLPKYVKVDGKIYRAVYKLEEDDTSDAYKRSYKRVEESETPGGDPVVKKDAQIYIDSGTLVVTNTVKATNTANIAAVKQLLGRNWMNTDDFEFEIAALGKGKYNKDTGKFESVDTSAEAKADVPMPGHYKNKNDDVISIEAYNALTDEQKANYEYVGNNKEAHAKINGTKVDPNGDLERLARFDSIEYKVSDLTYDPSDKHMQGDFFYVIKEKIPNDATIEVTEGDTTRTVTYADATAAQKAAGGFKKNGITYDGTEHIVHVKVRENRTGKLQTQISYDEKPKYNSEDYKADITTGTKFTPVFTNKYTSEVDVEVKGNKYIMGRDWAEGDNFDFVMIPMAGAPFKDANRSDFPANDTNTDREREAALEDKTDGIAIHNKDGEHVMRLFVNKNDEVQKFSFPKIKVKSEDLHKVTDEESQADPEQGAVDKRIKDKDGNVLPTGVTYGQFMYAIAETDEFDKLNAGSVKDLIKDSDTEYARVTVYDPGNGVLEYRVDIFEDRYGNIPRYKPDSETGEETKKPADAVTFVNKLDRDLTAIKAWDGTPTEDVTLKLQWSVLGDSSWHDVESTEWFPNIDGTKIIRKNATGDELKATWPKLPTYANISEYDDMSGESGDNKELNDMWIYYRVVEDPEPAQASVYYNEVAYKEGDNPKTTIIVEGVEKDKYRGEPYHTGPEKDENDEYLKPEKRVHTLHVTNFPTNNNVKASFGVVKQFIGRAWDKEEFQFVAEPVKSRLGGATGYINNGTYYKKGPKPDEMDQDTYDAAADILYEEDYEELPGGAVKDLYSEKQNSMPTEFAGNDNTATAKKSDDKKLKVSVNEYAANFKDLTIYRSDLAFNPTTKKMEGEFVYKIKEVIPANAEKTDDYVEDADGNKFYYYVVNDGKGNNIKYTSEEHFVTIKAVDEGSGTITTTVTYDGRKSGEYVPVYTNYALMPTPITGTKTWVGGKPSEHVNGEVTLNTEKTKIIKDGETPKDDLGLKLTRKLPGEQDYNVVDEDDGGRPLVIIWAKEKRKPVPRDSYFESGDTAVVAGKTYYYLDEDSGDYKEVTDTEGKSPKSEKWYEKTEVIDYEFEYEKQEEGDGTYTIKAEVTKDGETTYVDPLLKTVDDDGNEYEYKIDETDVPDKYKESIDGLDVTNTHKVKDNLKVTKTWDDAQDAEGLRPDKVIVHLYKEVIVPAEEGGEATTKTVQVEVDKKTIEPKGEEKDVWSTGVVFEDLPLYDSNGNVIKYYVLEEGVAGYTGTYAVDSTDADDYKDADHLDKVKLDGQKDREDPESQTDNPQFIDIKNSLAPKTDKVEVTKHWDDSDNIYGLRPDSVKVELWARVWDKEQDKYGEPEKAKRQATQTDVDAADPAGSIELGDWIDVDPIELKNSDDPAWKGEWTNLPMTRNGKTVLYSVKEVTSGSEFGDPGTPGKYSNEPIITGNQVDGFEVRNIYTPETKTAEVTKIWVDDSNRRNTRPEALQLQLWRMYNDAAQGQAPHYVIEDTAVTKDLDGEDIKTLISADDATSAANTWAIKIKDLPKYKRVKTSGEGEPVTYKACEYTYFWSEDVPTTEGYKATASANASGKTEDGKLFVDNKGTLTNTLNKTTVTITKKWVDKDGKTVRPNTTKYKAWLKLMAGSKDVTETYKDNLTVTESGDTYTAKWTDLPMFAGDAGQDATPIVYTVTEEKNGEKKIPGYDNPVYKNAEKLDKDRAYDKGTIVNNQLISIDVVKNWVDNNDHDSQRPEEIKIKLFRNGDLDNGKEVTLKKGEVQNAAKGGTFTGAGTNEYKWTKVFVDLPYADKNGVPYNYTAVETEAKNADGHWYDAFIQGDTDLEKMRQILLSTWNEAGDTLTYEITNKDDDDKVAFTVDKIWNDGSDVDNLRPANIRYRLYQDYEGIAEADKLISTLPDGATVKTVTNTAGEVTGTATYSDGYVEIDAKKEDITNGSLNRIIFEGLPKYAQGGKLITYTIEEDGDVTNDSSNVSIEPIRGYNIGKIDQMPTITGNQIAGYTVKNDHDPVSVTTTPKAIKKITGRSFKTGDEFTFKLAVDAGSPANTPTPTPDWITIKPTSGNSAEIKIGELKFTGVDMKDKLKKDDKKTFKYKLTEVNGGKTIDDLKYDDSELALSVTVERNADGTLKISDVKWGTNNTNEERTFTNEYGSKKQLTLRKVWMDKNADDSARPNEVKFTLTATIGTNDGVWADDTKNELLKADFSKVAGNSKKYTKVYTLTKDDKADTTEPGKHKDIWQIDTRNLPIYDAVGGEIDYSVSEDKVPKYKAPKIVVKGNLYSVTNEFVDHITIPVRKVWKDGNDQDGLRGDVVVAIRQASGSQGTWDGEDVDGKVLVDSTGKPTDKGKLTLNDNNNYKDKFDKLPAYDKDGKEISYSVYELTVAGKEPGERGYSVDYALDSGSELVYGDDSVASKGKEIIVRNTHTPKKIEVSAEKRWLGDGEVKSDTRKDVTFYLIGRYTNSSGKNIVAYDGGEKTIKINGTHIQAGDDVPAGSVTWDDLPKYLNGNELKWTVYEVNVPGYVVSGGDKPVTTDAEGNAEFVIKNEYVGSVGTVKATKIWDDEDNVDKKRSQVYFQLYRQIGPEGDEEVVGDPVKVATGSNFEDNTTKIWNNLPQTLTGKGKDTYEQVEIDEGDTVNPKDKGWYEKNGSEYLKTEDETVQPDKAYYEKKDNATEQPVYYWVKELHKNAQGEFVVGAPDDYDALIYSTKPGEFEVRNILKYRESVHVKVKKIWSDAGDADGLRPKHIVISLMKGKGEGEEVDKAVVEGPEWTHTFGHLPKSDDEGEIKYWIKEDDIPGYTMSGGDKPLETDAEGDAEFVITNTHNTEALYKVIAIKNWSGDNDHTDARKDVKFHLIQVVDGEKKEIKDVKTIKANAKGDDLKVEWNDLPIVKGGKKISYTVKEDDVDGYTTSVGDTKVDNKNHTMTVTVTNKYVPAPSPAPVPTSTTKKVTYIDPRAKSGKMILNATLYASQGDADKAAKAKSEAPKDPKHKGHTFIGWVLNQDKYGDYIYVAQYSEKASSGKVVVSYVDGNSKKGVIKYKVTDDPSKVSAPSAPSHSGLQFAGWKKTVDPDGNVIYVAQYKADCGNVSKKVAQKIKKLPSGSLGVKAGPPNGNGGIVKTGDTSNMMVWFAAMAGALALLVIALLTRKKKKQ